MDYERINFIENYADCIDYVSKKYNITEIQAEELIIRHPILDLFVDLVSRSLLEDNGFDPFLYHNLNIINAFDLIIK